MRTMRHWTSRAYPFVVPARRLDVAVFEIGDELILTHPVSGGTYHLNPTGCIVWNRCDGMTTTRTIARDLADTCDVDPEEALNDVEELVVWLAEFSLLQTVPAS